MGKFITRIKNWIQKKKFNLGPKGKELQKYIQDHPGCTVLVSQDIWDELKQKRQLYVPEENGPASPLDLTGIRIYVQPMLFDKNVWFLDTRIGNVIPAF